ncbi:MAG: tryptophan synthase subunit alpha [Gammaproteobacteria bacterium]|nr:tryptophan synthase subunit alpha [Gammaproteobacteria bacterium]
MSRISDCFESLKERNRVALIPFVTAGDPDPDQTVPLMHAMVAAGADMIELGIPFSDPMADGPVIQRASERALEHGVTLRDVLAMVRRFRAENAGTPVILMGYLNPVEALGYERFAREAAECGVDGLLTVDIPPEEAEELITALRPQGIAPIFLISPTSTRERVKRICDAAEGYVYYVSVKGITGSADLSTEEVERRLKVIREITSLPVGVGFGIKDPETARAVAQVGDAVIVGSALIKRIEEHADQPGAMVSAVTELLAGMRSAMDSGC